MKPEELLEFEKMPEDLHWVVTRYRLQPDDPVFLLIAWHWNRMKACEDTLRLGLAEMKAALDSRVAALVEAADTVTGVNDLLVELQQALEGKPEELGAQLEAGLKLPLSDAVGRLKALETSLAPLAQTFQLSRRRQLLAVLLIGVALGVLSSATLFLA